MKHTCIKVTTFKERLSDLCAENPMNDTEIARELRISKQTLSAWKCGTRSPKELTIISIARYFGVNVEWLMGFDVEKEANGGKYTMVLNDTTDPKLVKIMDSFSPEDQQRMKDFAEGLMSSHKK